MLLHHFSSLDKFRGRSKRRPGLGYHFKRGSNGSLGIFSFASRGRAKLRLAVRSTLRSLYVFFVVVSTYPTFGMLHRLLALNQSVFQPRIGRDKKKKTRKMSNSEKHPWKLLTHLVELKTRTSWTNSSCGRQCISRLNSVRGGIQNQVSLNLFTSLFDSPEGVRSC